MPQDIIVSAQFAAGDKALIVNETSGRAYYNIVKVLKVKTISPDVDVNGTDIITYTVEVYAPNTTNKLNLDVVESQLIPFADFQTAFDTF